MNNVKIVIQAALLLTVHAAVAQDALPAIPPIPAGMPPVLSWALSLLSLVATVTLPIGVAFLKQRLGVANTADRNEMIDRAVRRGALVSFGNQMNGDSPAQATAAGLAYVKNGVPDAIGKTNEATDAHLAHAIQAEVVALNQTGLPVAVAPAPSSGSGATGVILPYRGP